MVGDAGDLVGEHVDGAGRYQVGGDLEITGTQQPGGQVGGDVRLLGVADSINSSRLPPGSAVGVCTVTAFGSPRCTRSTVPTSRPATSTTRIPVVTRETIPR